METNKNFLGKINTQRCSVTLTPPDFIEQSVKRGSYGEKIYLFILVFSLAFSRFRVFRALTALIQLYGALFTRVSALTALMKLYKDYV